MKPYQQHCTFVLVALFGILINLYFAAEVYKTWTENFKQDQEYRQVVIETERREQEVTLRRAEIRVKLEQLDSSRAKWYREWKSKK